MLTNIHRGHMSRIPIIVLVVLGWKRIPEKRALLRVGWRTLRRSLLERHMVRRLAAKLAFLLVVLGATGCFDVRTIDPGPYIVDDFDDGDFQPADPNFQTWQCYGFNLVTSANINCDHDTGDQSAFSLFLDATIVDPSDGTQQHGGASLATDASAPEDFTHFSQFRFSAKLESGSPPIPSNALLYVELGCDGARAEDGSLPGNLYVVQGVDYKSYWQPFTLAMDSFNSPPWLATHIMGGPAGCLQRISNIRFTVDAQLPDGQTGKFVLHVDTISLQ